MNLEQAINFLVYTLTLAGAVNVFIESLKPTIFQKILERNGEQLYLASIYVTRAVAAFVGVLLFGGAEPLRLILPGLVIVPDLGLIVITSLLITAGADFVHVILDYLYALRDVRRTESEPATNPLEALARIRELQRPNDNPPQAAG